MDVETEEPNAGVDSTMSKDIASDDSMMDIFTEILDVSHRSALTIAHPPPFIVKTLQNLTESNSSESEVSTAENPQAQPSPAPQPILESPKPKTIETTMKIAKLNSGTDEEESMADLERIVVDHSRPSLTPKNKPKEEFVISPSSDMRKKSIPNPAPSSATTTPSGDNGQLTAAPAQSKNADGRSEKVKNTTTQMVKKEKTGTAPKSTRLHEN